MSKRKVHENSLKNLEGGKFKKGHPGGPGRPKGSVTAAKMLRELMSKELDAFDPFSKQTKKMSAQQIMLLKMMAQAMNGDKKAFELIFDRMEGKPHQSIQQETINVTAEDIANMTDEELEELRRRLSSNE